MIDFLRGFYLRTILFCLQLYIGTAPFLLGRPRKEHFRLLMPLSIAVFFALNVAVSAVSYYCFTELPPLLQSLTACVFFVVVTFLFALQIMIPFDVPYYNAFFLAVGGYSIEHIGEALSKIVFLALGSAELSMAATYTIRYIIAIAVSLAFYFVLIRKAEENDMFQYPEKRVWMVSAVNLFVCIILSVLSDYGLDYGATEINGLVSRLYAAIGCLLCLFLQAGFFREGRLYKEKEQLQKVLDMSREQHRISKETIDSINIKCHDIRYQLRLMSGGKDGAFIQKLTDTINIYDSICKTGSETLDLVLMEKKLLCESRHIEFKVVADGTVLSFVEDSDLYALFGNMLDNAIESSSKNPDEEGRYIILEVFTRGELLYIHEENDSVQQPAIVDGFPETTKEDRLSHGYGVRSMDYLSRQYGGEIMFHAAGGRFHVEILIPLPEAA